MRLPRPRLLVVAPIGLLVLAAGALLAWRLAFRDTATPADVGAAVTRFRGGTTAAPRPGLPRAGVYVYATTGFERIDALGGARHRYPARSTITVTPTACGSTLRWDVLTARWTAWDYCLTARGLVRKGSREVHRFFGRTERTTYRCGDGWLVAPRSPRAGAPWPLRCSEDGSRERGTGSVVGFEVLRVGGRAVRTVHLRERSTLAGGTKGTSADDLWLRVPDRLPIRLVTVSETANPSLVGDVHYTERATLALVSLEPRG